MALHWLTRCRARGALAGSWSRDQIDQVEADLESARSESEEEEEYVSEGGTSRRIPLIRPG